MDQVFGNKSFELKGLISEHYPETSVCTMMNEIFLFFYKSELQISGAKRGDWQKITHFKIEQ